MITHDIILKNLQTAKDMKIQVQIKAVITTIYYIRGDYGER